ncbi:MAG: IS21-like element helper ATPase IstB [Pseudoalteromonas sp.]|uniref:IS21-like element helper ATPase IstB n=1 Tax=Pseudoalteromonas sp. TaxID=53249 RepID=UPI0025DE2E24|nr:IS21-like element helper ATPase IstB [Pseudoalteromonas sp.]MCH2088286.1 IS21-like element helper ATPase IstB [Pseudoalteromonas sp.]
MSNEHSVFENLQTLRLMGMTGALQKVLESPDMLALPLLDVLAFLTCEEMQFKSQKKRERMFKAAKLKQGQACIENMDYLAKRGIDKSHFVSLVQCDWVQRNQFLIITGPTGVGKSWIACALANQAIKFNIPVLYKRFALLLEELDIARRDGSLPKLRAQLAKFKLLILDDWAMVPLNERNRQDILELVEERIESGSLLITTQLPVSKWHEYIGEITMADAIMDRIVHRAHRLELQGGSMRKCYKNIEGDAS